MNKHISSTILASAMLTSTGLGQGNKLGDVTVNRLADVIFRAENSPHHPYGVMLSTEHPRAVCINTIQHAWGDFEREMENSAKKLHFAEISGKALPVPFSLPFISFLGKRYCPPSVDSKGYKNWTNNVYRIVNEKVVKH